MGQFHHYLNQLRCYHL